MDRAELARLLGATFVEELDDEVRALDADLRALAGAGGVLADSERLDALAARLAAAPAREPAARVRAVAIAASTGGQAAVHRLISELPVDFPAPVLVVQQLARGFLAGFAAWLNDAAALRVAVARDGEPLLPGRVYLAPEERHLGVGPGLTVEARLGAPIGGSRPAATYLFASLAALGASGVAVLLTGTGSDGVEGLDALRRAGGRALVQDEESSVAFDAPRAAIAAGLATEVLPLARMAARLVALAGGG